jgi:hypothetical protein
MRQPWHKNHVYICGKCDHVLSAHSGDNERGYVCPCGCVFFHGDVETTVCQREGSCTHGPYDRWRPADNEESDE